MSQASQGTIADDFERRLTAGAVEAEKPLVTVRLNPTHRTRDFTCVKSANVTKFIREQAVSWVEQRYCGVFVLEDPNDPTKILGYYSLSQFVLSRDEMKSKHR